MTFTIPMETLPLSTDSEGVVRVGGSRVPIETLIGAFEQGATAEEIAQQYPSLALADVYQTIGYYLTRPADLERYLERRKSMMGSVCRENERRFDPSGIRDRLNSRKRK
jgi:uncharacterized protein (DUF433 family)